MRIVRPFIEIKLREKELFRSVNRVKGTAELFCVHLAFCCPVNCSSYYHYYKTARAIPEVVDRRKKTSFYTLV